MNTQKSKFIYSWLIICSVMIFFMILIGGITRLTDSGLSMTSWKPITGFLPPISESAWQESFAHYQQFPEYQKVNLGMTLAEYKKIFWWEYIHRNWGRALGIIFFIPLVFFWLKNQFSPHEKKWLTIASFLGIVQAVVGWWMVKSGMSNHPHVSHIRLTAHLSLALTLLGILFMLAQQIKYRVLSHHFPGKKAILLSFIFIFFLILSGAWVAGQDAGLVYNTFPKMGTYWLPPEILSEKNSWVNKLLYDPVVAQFIHRIYALMTFFGLLTLALILSKHHSHMNNDIFTFVFILTLQVSLGIITLLSQVWIPAAILHQANAIFLFLFMIKLYFKLGNFR